MLRSSLAAVALIAGASGHAHAASVTLDGVAAGGASFSVDAFPLGTPPTAIFFQIDPLDDPTIRLDILSNTFDIDGNLDVQTTVASAFGSTFTLQNDVLTALLEVSFDSADQFADFVTVTVAFTQLTDDIFAIDSQEVTIGVADASTPPAVVPLPGALALMASGLVLLGGLRRRA